METAVMYLINGRTVRPAMGTIEGPQGTIRLEPRVMDLLSYLAASGGRVVPREDIIRVVWRSTLVTDDVITRSISQIRRALAEDWRKTPVIETIPKRGYRLVAEVETIEAAPHSSVPKPPIAVTEAPIERIANHEAPAAPMIAPPKKRLRVRYALAALLVFGLAIGVAVYFKSSQLQPVPATPPSGLNSSVMIAPFVRSGEAAGGDYLAAELSGELIDALASASDLRVIGANSSRALIRAGESPLDGARKLGVETLVTGTVQQTDEQLLVAISVIHAGTGRIIRHHNYRFAKDQAMSASATIAPDLAAMLGGHVIQPLLASEKPTNSPSAYRLFVEAQFFIAKNEAGSIAQGIEFLREAVKIDPGFAEAHAALSMALMLQIDFSNAHLANVQPEAQREIDQAFALRPKLAQAFAGQGLIDMDMGRPEEAATALTQAVALRPNYAQAHMWLGLAALSQWQLNKCIASYQRALEIEPLSVITTMNLGMAFDLVGSYDQAEQTLRHGMVLQPQFANLHWALAHTLLDRGQLNDADNEYLTAVHLGINSPTVFGQLAMLQFDLGKAEDARGWILRGETINPADHTVWLARVMSSVMSHRFEDLRGAKVFREGTLATADFYRRDYASAQSHFAEARLRRDADYWWQSAWLTIAGHAPALDEAAADILGGHPLGAEKLKKFADSLAVLRSNGADSPGMAYEEAAIASLQGEHSRALEWLKTARQRGWREDWFMAFDPKMNSQSAL